MDVRLETTLIECLSLLDDGEPIETILARYPAEAEQLRPLLEVATALPALSIAPSQAAQISSRRAFLNQAHELSQSPRPGRFRLPARLGLGLAVLVLAFLIVGGSVAASGAALPGEPLYSVKRAVEDTRLLIAPQSAQPSLAELFQQRRRDEVSQLLSERRAAAVAFEGSIEAFQSGQWTIDGFPVRIDQGTMLFGTPGIGALAHVQGHTSNGQLFATLIRIEPGTGMPPTATPSPTAPPTPTRQPTATAQPTATIFPTATATPQPSATPTVPPPSRTATQPPAPAPTRPPAPTPIPAAPPTAEPEHAEPELEVEVELTGSVESIGTTWRVNGSTIEVDAGSEIGDAIRVGDTVRVRAVRLPDGRLVARRIERRDANQNGGDDNGGNSGSGSNSGSDNSGSGSNNSGSGSDGGDSNSGGGSDDHGSGGGGGSDRGGGGSRDSGSDSSGSGGHGGGG